MNFYFSMNFTRGFRSVYWLYIAIIAVAIFCGKNPVIQLEMMSPVRLLTNVFPIGGQRPLCLIHLVRGPYYNFIPAMARTSVSLSRNNFRSAFVIFSVFGETLTLH